MGGPATFAAMTNGMPITTQPVLVTGATGFLGRFIVQELLEAGYSVRALIRSEAKAKLALPQHPKLSLAQGDVLEVGALAEAFEGVGAVVHSAAVVSFSKKDKALMREVNAVGTRNVVNLCLANGVERLAHISSVAALGKPPSPPGTKVEDVAPITEANKWTPGPRNSHYGYTKHLAELEVQRGVQEGLRASMINPTVILGPGLPGQPWKDGPPAMFSRVAKGLRFYPVGMNGFVGVWDVACAARLLLEADDLTPGSRFVVVGENLFFKDLFSMMARALGKKPPRTALAPGLAIAAGTFFEWIAAITGRRALVTREAVRAANGIARYSAAGFEARFNYAFAPILAVVDKTAPLYTG